MPNETKNGALFTVKGFCEKHGKNGWPTEASLRYHIFNEHSNGFHKCVKRVGSRVLIDENAFFIWVEEQNKVEGCYAGQR